MTTPPPGGTDTTLMQYVRASASDAAFVTECEERANALIARHLREMNGVPSPLVPAVVRRAAVLEVGADLFNRRQTRNGIAGFGNGADDYQPVRIARDPLTCARPILAPYLEPGIA